MYIMYKKIELNWIDWLIDWINDCLKFHQMIISFGQWLSETFFLTSCFQNVQCSSTKRLKLFYLEGFRLDLEILFRQLFFSLA